MFYRCISQKFKLKYIRKFCIRGHPRVPMSYYSTPPVSPPGSPPATSENGAPLRNGRRGRTEECGDTGKKNISFDAIHTDNFACDVDELTEEQSSECSEDVLGFPTKNHRGVVKLTCKKNEEKFKSVCWAPNALRGTLDNYSTKNPESSVAKTGNGTFHTELYSYPASDNVQGGFFVDAGIVNSLRGIAPFDGEYPRNITFRYKKSKASGDETLEDMLERLSALYDDPSNAPEESVDATILTPTEWNSDFEVVSPETKELWTKVPLSELYDLYFTSRDQFNVYHQLNERMKNSSLKESDNDGLASLQAAVPTTKDLVEYLFGYVILTGERLHMAIAQAKRRRGDMTNLVENMENLLKNVKLGERLTYDQTRVLVSIGFRALDPTLYSDINVRPPPFGVEAVIDTFPQNGSVGVMRMHPTKASIFVSIGPKIYEKVIGENEWIELYAEEKDVVDMAFRRNGESLIVVRGDNTISVFDITANPPKKIEHKMHQSQEITQIVSGSGENFIYLTKNGKAYMSDRTGVHGMLGDGVKQVAVDSKDNKLSHELLENGQDQLCIFWSSTVCIQTFLIHENEAIVSNIGTTDEENTYYIALKACDPSIYRGFFIVSYHIDKLTRNVTKEVEYEENDETSRPFFLSSGREELLMVTENSVILPLTTDGVVYESPNEKILEASASENYVALRKEGAEIVILKKN